MNNLLNLFKYRRIGLPKMSHSLSHYDPAVRQVEKALAIARSSKVPAELTETLELASQLIRKRDQFTEANTSQESAACKNIFQETYKHDWNKVHSEGKTTWNLSPSYMTGSLEGQFLKSIVSIQQCKRILDVGMFTGYSALSMAEALPADGKLVSLDQDEYLKKLVQENFFKLSPHSKKIEIRIGDAEESIKKMIANGEQFDLIFLDATQSYYIKFFQYIFDQNLLKPRGTVLIDNAFMYGSGYLNKGNNKFTDYLSSNPNLHKVFVPLRDGILMVRRTCDVEGSVN